MAAWTPQPEDIQRVLREQNPWKHIGRVPRSLAHPTERPPAKVLWRLLLDDEPRRFQLILGPRRVGKTTVLYQTVRHLLDQGVSPKQIWWFRMDHPLLIRRSLGDWVRAALDVTSEHPVYLMLDELVYAEEWDLWLKAFYDERWPVRVAATSSATAALRNRRLESGAGRWSEQYLMPYLFTEYLDLIGRSYEITAGETLADTLLALPQGQPAPHDLAAARRRFMLVGGFPEMHDPVRRREHNDGLSDEDIEHNDILESQDFLRKDAVERAVYKDIPQSFEVENPIMLERLLYTLAGQIAGILSPSNICREQGISQPTFGRYLSYLERTFLVFTLPNYSGREATVQKRGRKLYFVDGAVRNAALQRGLALLDNPAETGLLLENLVAASLQTLAVQNGVRLHHWREGRNEVDLIFNHPTRPLAFEIASSPDHSRSGLRALIERHERFRGACYLAAPQANVLHPDRSGIGTLPLDTLLLAVGSHARPSVRVPGTKP